MWSESTEHIQKEICFVTENMSLWNKVWSLNVPSKAKHLLWRMSQDLLPDSTIIRNQLVQPTDKVCLSCDSMDGGYTHTLIRCELNMQGLFGLVVH